MYTISGYGKMIADQVRMTAYLSAMRASIQPGAVVADIGAGTGIMSFLACQMGAEHVYAIEPDSIIEVAREIALENHFAERITFIQDLSTQITLPQPADVIVSDLRGVLPLFQQHLPSIVDARTRLLRPGGILIPQRDTLWAAVVSAADAYDRVVGCWEHNEYGLTMNAARRITVNTWSKARISPEQVVCPPQRWAVLDYTTIKQPDVQGSLRWTTEVEGLAHGLAVWFDTELVTGIGFSNAPNAPELIYGCAFMPWEQSVMLTQGDIIEVTLAADLIGDDYIWRWQTRIKDASGRRKVDFKQSTFFGAPLALERLHKRADQYIPRLNHWGQVDRFILNLMDNGVTVGAIAQQVQQRFPNRFADVRTALAYAADLSQKYGQ